MFLQATMVIPTLLFNSKFSYQTKLERWALEALLVWCSVSFLVSSCLACPSSATGVSPFLSHSACSPATGGLASEWRTAVAAAANEIQVTWNLNLSTLSSHVSKPWGQRRPPAAPWTTDYQVVCTFDIFWFFCSRQNSGRPVQPVQPRMTTFGGVDVQQAKK